MKKLLLTLFGMALCGSAFAQFENGYFIINEGQYGNEPGLLNFYSNETGEVSTKVYQEASGNTLGMTAEFGALGDGKLFITSKQNFGEGGRLVVANARTLETLFNATQIDDNADTRGVAVYEQGGKFYVGTNMGVYAYDINTYEQLGLVEGTRGEDASPYSPGMGDMTIKNGKLYVAAPDKIMVIDLQTDKVVSNIEINNVTTVFEANNKLYAAVNSCTWGTPGANDTEQFIEINDDNTLGRVYDVPMASPNTWFTPKPCKPVAVRDENAVIYCGGEGMKYLSKFNFDTETYTEQFITFDGRQQMYGHVVYANASSNDVAVCTFQSYSSLNYWFNIYDGITGETKVSVKMPNHYWFPSQIIKALDKADDDPTAVDEKVIEKRQVAGVNYYNLAGQMSQKPFDGINIVVTTYNDGTTEAVKIIK